MYKNLLILSGNSNAEDMVKHGHKYHAIIFIQ